MALKIYPWPIVHYSMRVAPTASDHRGNGPPPPNHVNNPANPFWVPAAIIEILQAANPTRLRLAVLSYTPFSVIAQEFDSLNPRYDTFKIIGPTILSDSFSLDPPSIAAGASLSPSPFAIAGAKFGDRAEATFNADLQGMTIDASISSSGFVRVVVENDTVSTVNLPPGILRIDVTQYPV